MEPFTYKLHTVLKYTFPDSSVLVGNLSDTLIYQLTRLEIKVYSLAELMRFDRNLEVEENHEDEEIYHGNLENQSHKVAANIKKPPKFASPISSHKLNYSHLPNGP